MTMGTHANIAFMVHQQKVSWSSRWSDTLDALDVNSHSDAMS